MRKGLTTEQGKELNKIFKEYGLVEMSISSVSLWFLDSAIYRNINHLTKDEIFKLFAELNHNQMFSNVAKSIFELELIVDTTIKQFSMKVGLLEG